MTKLLGSNGAESPAGNTGTGGGSKGATTFVQADSACFRDLVQRLTGPPVNETAQPMAAVKAPKNPTAKLHERRKLYVRPNIEIARPTTSFKVYQLPPAAYNNHQVQSPSLSSSLQVNPMSSCSPRMAPAYNNHQVQSPSLSSSLQVNPMSSCSPRMAPYSHSCGSNKRVSEDTGELMEEKTTKEKRFYLHPSPRSKPRLDPEDNGACTVSAQPKLLTLFPLTSPTAADTKFT